MKNKNIDIKKEIKLAEKEYSQYLKLASKALKRSQDLQRKLEGKPPLKKKKVTTESYQPYYQGENGTTEWLLKSR
jgi:hypothetical protein